MGGRRHERSHAQRQPVWPHKKRRRLARTLVVPALHERHASRSATACVRPACCCVAQHFDVSTPAQAEWWNQLPEGWEAAAAEAAGLGPAAAGGGAAGGAGAQPAAGGGPSISNVLREGAWVVISQVSGAVCRRCIAAARGHVTWCWHRMGAWHVLAFFLCCPPQEDGRKPVPRYEQGAALLGTQVFMLGGHYGERCGAPWGAALGDLLPVVRVLQRSGVGGTAWQPPELCCLWAEDCHPTCHHSN